MIVLLSKSKPYVPWKEIYFTSVVVNSQAKGRNSNVKVKAVVILKKKAHQGRELWFNRWVMSLHVCMIYQASANTVRRDYMQQVI